MENSLWKSLWTCREVDYEMGEWMNEWMNELKNEYAQPVQRLGCGLGDCGSGIGFPDRNKEYFSSPQRPEWPWGPVIILFNRYRRLFGGGEVGGHVLVEWRVSCRFATYLVMKPIYVSRKKCLGNTSVKNVCEGVPSRVTQVITKVTNFGPFSGHHQNPWKKLCKLSINLGERDIFLYTDV